MFRSDSGDSCLGPRVRIERDVARLAIESSRLHVPDGMVSVVYKKSVVKSVGQSTETVYDEPFHPLLRRAVTLSTTDLVAENLCCAPLRYRPAEEPALR